MTLTAEQARELFVYEPETGRLSWRSGARAGKEAGSLYANGYRVVRIGNRERCTAGRLIWLIQTGEWPGAEIDHINRDRSDNRWSNLRDVPSKANAANRGMRAGNASGVQGVSWHKTRRRWYAHIRQDGAQKSLGYFEKFEDAVAARARAESLS